MKTIAQQVQAMRRHWPSFEVAGQTVDQAVWFGSLAGIERSYRVMVEYRLTQESRDHGRYKPSPSVQVLSPPLRLQFNAREETPLPHVYFDEGRWKMSCCACSAIVRWAKQR
jgi:hypothetical protein